MNTRRFAAVVGAFCLCGCIVEAGVQGGARIAHEPEFSWGNHALAMVAPHPVRLGTEFGGTSVVDVGNRWTVGLTGGVAFSRPAPRPGSVGTELRADLGVPIEGTAFGPRGEWYWGGTFEATFWWWRRHQGADINRAFWLFNIIPEIGLFSTVRVYRERDTTESMNDLVTLMFGVSIRLKIVSDLVEM